MLPRHGSSGRQAGVVTPITGTTLNGNNYESHDDNDPPPSPRGVAQISGGSGGGKPDDRGQDGPLSPSLSSMPTNYAYSERDGYEGLTLYALSPRLAEMAYPWIATMRTETYIVGLLFVTSCVTISPMLSAKVPPWPSSFSWLLYIPSFHRLALIDLRICRLAFRQFETLYMVSSMLIMMGCVVSGILPTWAEVYCENFLIAMCSALILDAVRTPPVVTLCTACMYSGLATVGTTVFLLEQAQHVIDYKPYMFAHVTVVSVFMGRMATLAIYFTKYAFNLWHRPGCYVVLHRPILLPPEEGSISVSPTFILNTTPEPVNPTTPTDTRPLRNGLAVLSSPRHALRIEAALMATWLVAAVLACLALSPPGASPISAQTSAGVSFLLYLPSLPLLPALDVFLLPRLLCQQFETTLVLLGNILFAVFCCATGVFVSTATTIISVNIVLSSLPILAFDAMRVPARIKLHRAAAYSAFYGALMLRHGLTPLYTLDTSKVLFGRLTIAAMFMGRLLTLAIFYLKYTVNLYLRPNVCLILRAPLMKSEGSSLMVRTLRDAGVLLEADQPPPLMRSGKGAGAGEKVAPLTACLATAAGGASSAVVGGGGGGNGGQPGPTEAAHEALDEGRLAGGPNHEARDRVCSGDSSGRDQ